MDSALAVLRTQLASPTGRRRMDELLAADNAGELVAACSEFEIFALVQQAGLADSLELLSLATPAQWRGCIDFAIWDVDRPSERSMMPWLEAMIELGYEKVGEVWNELDAELRAFFIQRNAVIFDLTLGEEPSDSDDRPRYHTPDTFLVLVFNGDEASRRLTHRLVEDLYRADPVLARHTLMAARSEITSELEETAYRWRTARLADEGFVEPIEAMRLFEPLAINELLLDEKTLESVGEPTSAVPLAIAEEAVGKSFLARCLQHVPAGEAGTIASAMQVIVNYVMAAAHAKPGEETLVRRAAAYTTATISLALEERSKGDALQGASLLSAVAPMRLFRAGYTLGAAFAPLARRFAGVRELVSSPDRELMTTLGLLRPLFARECDRPPASGPRPIEHVADLHLAARRLGLLAAKVRLCESWGVSMEANPDIPMERRPMIDDYVRTATVRAIAGTPGAMDPLTRQELDAFFAALENQSTAIDAARARFRQWLSDADVTASSELLEGLVVPAFNDVADRLGGLRGQSIDARFVEGVFVAGAPRKGSAAS